MGIGSKALPVIVVRAVIDRDIVRSAKHYRASEDIIELS